MVNTNVRAVQGLCVKTAVFNAKKNQVKLTLEADKDDIRAGTGTIADVLVSLEFHSTGADSSPVSVALQGSPYEFAVGTFKGTQDKLSVVLLTPEDEDDGDENVNGGILSACAQHALSNTPVEVTMARAGADVAGI